MSSLEESVDLLKPPRIKNIMEALRRIAEAAKELGCRAMPIGSYAMGEATPASDVDVLIICRELPRSMIEQGKLKALIEDKAGLPPVNNIHLILVNEKQAEWFIKKKTIWNK